jgi:lysozyme
LFHRFSKGIRPIAQAAPRVAGVGALTLGLMLSLGQRLEAERSNERNEQNRAVAQALSTQRSETTTSQTEASPYVITPERRALLNTIRYAEGTWKDGKDLGYRILYGGGQFQDLSRHPDRVVVKRYSSAAAGAYQFLPSTWQEVSRSLELPSFAPEHQDQAALHLVKKRGALQEVDRNGLTKAAMNRLAPEWASFPTHAGISAYGQPVKTHAELVAFYRSNLSQLREGA